MEQTEYFWSHPPRCIAGFTARPVELPGVEFDGHASLSQLKFAMPPGVTIEAPEHICPIFALACSCGGVTFFVHGYRWVNPDYADQPMFLSPITLECRACGKHTDLLDTGQHGFDAELGHVTTSTRAKGDRVVYACPYCGRQPLEVCIRFEYPDDLFDLDFKEFAGREQDLFTWVNIAGKCPKCSRLLAVADFECA